MIEAALITSMADAIAEDGRALADYRAIIFDLHARRFRPAAINEHLEAAIQEAREILRQRGLLTFAGIVAAAKRRAAP